MRRQAGFTMIELLVVVTIIAVLLGLILFVVGGLVSNARDAATRATLLKIQGLLDSRSQAFQRMTMRKGFSAATPEYQIIRNQYPNLQASTQQILTLKLLQRRYFPQMPAEVNPAYMPIDSTTNKPLLLQPKLTNPPMPPSSSAILYDFLTQEFLVGDTSVGADAFTASEVVMNQSNGLNEFVDAWGNKLRFYRWPTRLFRSGGQVLARDMPPPNPQSAVAAISQTDTMNARLLFSTLPVFTGNLASDLNRDPIDPLRECEINFDWLEKTTINVNGLSGAPDFHTPGTYWIMLVVSAGPDGQIGLYEPEDFTNFGHLAMPRPGEQDFLTDNIASLSIKAGGNR